MSDEIDPDATAHPPSPWRNPWVLLSAAALALLAVLGGLSIWRGTPTPTVPAGDDHAPGVTTPSTRMVAPGDLGVVLLSPEQMRSLTHAPGLKPDGVERDMLDPTYTLSRPECLSALHAVVRPAYQGSGWTAMNSQYLAEPGASIDHEVRQGAVLFPSAAEAEEFAASSLTKWKACVGQTVTVTTSAGEARRVTFENLTGATPTISLFSTIDAPPDWACQRALRAVSNLVIDVGVCGRGVTDDASRIAYEMSVNVDKLS